MKKSLFVLAALLFSIALQAQSDLYSRYASQPGVKVASVSNFPLDSVSQIDVTVIEAEDDEGWAWMKREFLIVDLLPEQQADIDSGNDVVFFARRNRSNPAEGVTVQGDRIDAASSCYIGISYLDRAVYIFCADNETQSEAVATLLVKKIMHSSR